MKKACAVARNVLLGISVVLPALFALSPAAQTAPEPPAAREVLAMTQEQASSFARLALQGVRKEYPNKPADVLIGEKDVKATRAVHPAFYGSFDWHSSVHGHWMLVRLLRLFPELPEKKQIRAVLAEHLTADNLQAEADAFNRPNAQSFERPYGWAWLLKLAEELHGWDDPDAREWSKNLKPLADAIAARFTAYFPKQTYPIRGGVHANTAFALGFILDYARAAGDKKLAEAVEERSRAYFAKDAAIPAAWEPDGADFLSPSLEEADLMRRVLPPDEFQTWFRSFLPDLAKGELKSLLEPANVTDRSDPQLVHLDGLNLSRAWCMRSIAAALPQGRPGPQGPGPVGQPPRGGGAQPRRQRRLRRRALAGVVRRVPVLDAFAGLSKKVRSDSSGERRALRRRS